MKFMVLAEIYHNQNPPVHANDTLPYEKLIGVGNCPEGWSMTDYSKRICGRATDGGLICDSVTFSVSGVEYSQVCGRIRAYQWGYTGGFYG